MRGYKAWSVAVILSLIALALLPASQTGASPAKRTVLKTMPSEAVVGETKREGAETSSRVSGAKPAQADAEKFMAEAEKLLADLSVDSRNKLHSDRLPRYDVTCCFG